MVKTAGNSRNYISPFERNYIIKRKRTNSRKYSWTEMTKSNAQDHQIIRDQTSNYTTELYKASMPLKLEIKYSGELRISGADSAELQSCGEGSTVLGDTIIAKSHPRKIIAIIKIIHLDVAQSVMPEPLEKEHHCGMQQVCEVHVLKNKISVNSMINLGLRDENCCSNNRKVTTTAVGQSSGLINHMPSVAAGNTKRTKSDKFRVPADEDSFTLPDQPDGFIHSPGSKSSSQGSQDMTRWSSAPNVFPYSTRVMHSPVRVETVESFCQTNSSPEIVNTRHKRIKRKSKFRTALEDLFFSCSGFCM